MREELKRPLLEVARILGITLAVYLVMKFLLPLVIPFLISLLLAKLLHPMVEKLHKKTHIKKGFLAAVILLFFLAVLVWALWIMGKNIVVQIQSLLSQLPSYQEKAAGLWRDCCSQMEQWTGIQAETLDVSVTSTVPKVWEQMKGTLLPALMSGSFSWVKSICVAAGICIVIGISTLLMIKDYQTIKRAMGKGQLGRSVLSVLRRVYRAGGGYIKAQIVIMILVSTVCVVGLFCAGNSYALLAGMGIGLCDAMPFLGTGTIFIPWAVLELLKGEYLLAAVYAVLYTIATLVRELLEPRLVGDKLGMPPVVVIISVFMGLGVYGLWGFALGPLTYILVREIWRELFGFAGE